HDSLFFSSRRRHTRCLSDWSSDVCSSDLILRVGRSRNWNDWNRWNNCEYWRTELRSKPLKHRRDRLELIRRQIWIACVRLLRKRSEERRVGKEWGGRCDAVGGSWKRGRRQ